MSSALALIPILGLVTGQPNRSGLAPWEPINGCYIGAYIDLDGNCRGDIDAFERLAGRKHASYFRYVGYGAPFPFEWIADLHARKCAAHIAWEPNDGLTNVQDDEYLRGWAEAARHSGAPIFLRYASEMNGTWQAYSGDPELYKEKWRIVCRAMHEVAPNVAMVWCPFSMPRRTIQPYYPGDEFVDWVGVNIYSVHHHDGDPTRPGGEDPRDELQYVYDLYASRKPIQICEYGATHYCGACDTWVPSFACLRTKELYAGLKARFPAVKMVNWFSVDTIGEGLAENNYSVTDDPTILGTYRQLTADPYFLDTVPADDSAAPALIASHPPEDDGSGPPKEGALPPIITPVQPHVPVITADPPREIPLPADGARIVLHQRGRAISGSVLITIEIGEEVPVRWIEVSVDGVARYLASLQPFRWTWDTTPYANGEHILKLTVYDPVEAIVGHDELRVIIDNG